MNQCNLHAGYGNVGGTRKHRWITTMVDKLPIGKRRWLLGNANGMLNGIFEVGTQFESTFTNVPNQVQDFGRAQRPARIPPRGGLVGKTPVQAECFDISTDEPHELHKVEDLLVRRPSPEPISVK